MVTGSEWLSSLPNLPGKQRDQMVLEGVSSGLLRCEWRLVTSTIGENTATFYVCDDAVRATLDDGSRFRPQCTAVLLQQVADLMDASLMTAKIMDLCYQQADVKLNATILAPTNMTTTDKSKVFNKELEKKRTGRDGLIRDCGKAWILSNLLAKSKTQAINYGYYDTNGPSRSQAGLKMYQTVGTRHDALHQDFSQCILLMSQYCQLNGQDCRVSDILTSKELAPLASYEGVLNYTRQPQV